MPRIRTIKPEFPQSESMGRVSREARLLFVLLFTIVDDDGRTRGSSRMLASLLFPYDDDAAGLIDRWLDELEREGCVRRYEVDGSIYLEICNWLKHQKIDKPSKSRLPSFDEGSRAVAKPREESATDLGPSTLDLGPSTRIKDQDSAEADVPVASTAATIFDRGRKYLEANGVGEKQARSMLGLWRRDYGDDNLIAALGEASRQSASEPIAFITAVLKQRRSANGNNIGARSAQAGIEGA